MEAGVARPIAVVGAGLAGLTAAQALVDGGQSVVVFDKGRAPGGRMSARVRPGFDHGAQYFTARAPEFSEAVRAWCERGVVARWSPALYERQVDGLQPKVPGPQTPSRYIGTPSMRHLLLHLAEGLDVLSSTTVQRCVEVEDGVQLFDAAGSSLGRFSRLVVTAPAPQAVALVREVAPDLAEQAACVPYASTWAALLAFEEPLPGPPWDGVFVHQGPLSWLAREASKPGRPPGHRFVAHARPDWSARHLELSPDEVLPALVEAFFDATAIAPRTPSVAQAHRWRYAFPEPPLDVGCLVDARGRVALGGDWTGGAARVESAWRAGCALSARLLELSS